MSERVEQMKSGKGFIAALDQSGGSTPKALERYGVPNHAFSSDDEMFDLIHAMRVRIITNDTFSRPSVLGAILFEGTMHREIEGIPSSKYLWEQKHVLPFLKVDKGLEDESASVQLMKPFDSDLRTRLTEASELGVFGTKMRSVIKGNNPDGIKANVEQQFDYAREILATGLIPIVEPEIDIEVQDKAGCEASLRAALHAGLGTLADSQAVVFKLTLPEEANFYQEFVQHDRVLRVAALSGGYSQDESNERLTQNNGMIASFSRALTEHLRVDQNHMEFSATLGAAIDGIAEASSS